MPQVGFKKHFAPLILAGKKPFTLRDLRKDGRDPKAGKTLYMFTGLRSKDCKKFAEKPCRFAVNVSLSWRKIFIPHLGFLTSDEELELFSQLDGFDCYASFVRFHGITAHMKTRTMRLIAWVTRDELKEMFAL